jgi:hypothetical protein
MQTWNGFFFLTIRKYNDPSLFHNDKKKNKIIENIGPPIIPLESFSNVLLIQLWFVTGFHSFPHRECQEKFLWIYTTENREIQHHDQSEFATAILICDKEWNCINIIKYISNSRTMVYTIDLIIVEFMSP